MTMVWVCDIRLPAAARGVRQARAVVDALGLDLPAELRDDLRLLLSEVVTNAVRHGCDLSGSRQDDAIRVRVGVAQDTLRVEVHDNGPGFEPEPRGPQAELGSGWGVHLVQTLADDWGTERDTGGTWIVWFELGLPSPRGTGAAMTYGQRASDGAPLRSDRSAGFAGPGDLAATR